MAQKPIKTESGVQNQDLEYVLFRDINKHTKPIVEMPEDTAADYKYRQLMEPKCAICQSDFRDRAEHVYIEGNKQVMRVIGFFAYHFGAKLNYTQVKTHMENHCSMEGIAVGGLKSYEGREEDLIHWRYRESHLALTALMCALDEVQAISAGKNKDLIMKRAQTVERLAGKIHDLAKQRDEAALSAIGGVGMLFSTLEDLHASMLDARDKQVIRQKTTELKDRLQKQVLKKGED